MRSHHLDAFDLDILRAAQNAPLRPFKRGWAANYDARHFPADRLNALVASGHAYKDEDEVGPIFAVTPIGRDALGKDDEQDRADRDAMRSLDTTAIMEAFHQGRLL